jgi:hypothetical protein
MAVVKLNPPFPRLDGISGETVTFVYNHGYYVVRCAMHVAVCISHLKTTMSETSLRSSFRSRVAPIQPTVHLQVAHKTSIALRLRNISTSNPNPPLPTVTPARTISSKCRHNLSLHRHKQIDGQIPGSWTQPGAARGGVGSMDVACPVSE